MLVVIAPLKQTFMLVISGKKEEKKKKKLLKICEKVSHPQVYR